MRELYDDLGDEGVKASWQLGQYTGTISEREKILQALREKEREKMMTFKTSSSVTAGLDATQWFDDYSVLGPTRWDDYIPQVGRLAIRQSYQGWITPATSADISVDLTAENGTGAGNTLLTVAHQRDATTRIDGGLRIGQQRSLFVGAGRAVSKRVGVSCRATGILQDGMIYPVLQGGASASLPHGIQAASTLIVGAQNAIVLSIGQTESTSSNSVTLQLSPRDVMIKYKSSLIIDEGLSLGMRLSLGKGSSGIAVGMRKVWSPLYRSAAYIILANSSDNDPGAEGVILELSLTREDDYKLALPIKLSSEMSVASILLGSAVPALAGFLLDRVVVKPWQRYIEQRAEDEHAEEIERHSEAKKIEALLVAEILRPAYEKKILSNPEGLLITDALYRADDGNQLDVTVPLQSLVVDDQLVLQGGSSKSSLLGFYNISPHSSKKLSIEYTFKGRKHACTIDDLDPVVLPQKTHFLPAQ